MSQASVFGDRFNLNDNIVVLNDRDPVKLMEQINSMVGQCSIIAIYGLGTRHYAWLLPSEKVKIVKKTKK